MASPPEQTSRQQEEHTRRDQRPTILVVDDEYPIASLIADTLQEEGYHVRVHHDGASALLDILQQPPDLVLLDIAMPVMVGDELLRRLRSRGLTELPVIVMTAGLRPEAYLAAGANAILPKPFDLNRMLDLVGKYLAPNQARMAGEGNGH